MRKDTTGEADVIRLRQDISSLLRRRVLEAVESVLEEELSEALGTGRYERSEERRGYRNGHETRRITTELGPQTLEVPRGRIVEDDGRAAGVPEPSGTALRASNPQGRRSDPGRVPGRGQHAAYSQGA